MFFKQNRIDRRKIMEDKMKYLDKIVFLNKIRLKNIDNLESNTHKIRISLDALDLAICC